MAQQPQQHGFPIPLVGGNPQPSPVTFQPSPQSNLIPLPGVQYTPGHTPGYAVAPLPQQGYMQTPGYFQNTPIVPMAPLPQVQYVQAQTQPTPHYALAANSTPLVMWDVFQPPSSIRATNPSFPIYLQVPAVDPPVNSMRLVCKDMPWIITIRKKEGQAVTVGDVFEAIYLQLQEPIIHSEWRLMGAGSLRNKVVQRFQQRVEFLKAQGKPDDSQGIRRVDYLLNRTAFVGIRQDNKAIGELVGDIDITNAWLLILSERAR